MFEICIQCHKFAKRCWWQLSSIAQQIDAPRIVVKLDIHKSDPFHYLNDNMVRTFRKRLRLNVKVWDDDSFFERGLVRDNNLIEATQPWVIYADADMVYNPRFFQELAGNTLQKDKMHIIHRYNVRNIGRCNTLVDSMNYTNTPIADIIKHLSRMRLRRSSAVGAGFFQMVSLPYMQHHQLTYSLGCRDRSLQARGGPSYRSDRPLRRKLGMNIIPMKEVAYHLNHYRGKNKEFNPELCR